MYLSEAPPVEQIYDVCVVGAGPVGIALALECESAGLSVLLLEAGGHGAKDDVGDMLNLEIVDRSFHSSLDITARSGIGGTSAIWGGRCVPFDALDFERRSFVPDSSWPISQQDIAAWYSRAAYYLDCGAGEFSHPVPALPTHELTSHDSVERLSSAPRLARRFRDRLKKSAKISILLNHGVVGLDFDPQSSSVCGVHVDGAAARGKLRGARSFVLACGGLQSTRLLLALQRTYPQAFGGDNGPLGRYYMGHLTGRIARIVLSDPRHVADFEYSKDADGHWFRRRLTLSPATQLENGILNTAFWLGSPPLHDPGHGSASASSLFLGMYFSGMVRRRVSEHSLGFHWSGESGNLGEHFLNVRRNPAEIVRVLADAVNRRFTPNELRPFFIRNDRGVYALHYHAEQYPDPANRVRLNGRAPLDNGLLVDFRFTRADAQSVVKAHRILDKSLRESGLGRVEYLRQGEELEDHVLEQALDGYHQMGTTRMSASPNDGVVDRNCRVHSINNLFVAASSVFTTSSQANPTFMAVTMATRLAKHLHSGYAH